jgi:hypothetical protein
MPQRPAPPAAGLRPRVVWIRIASVLETRPSFGRAMAMAAAGVVGAALAIHGWHAVTTGSYVDFVSGVWLTLADDLAHGVFYRDLIGPDGYGGTRYFPLFFTPIGALIRLGASPVASGLTVSLGAGALLLLGVRQFLTRIGLIGPMAVALSLFVLAPRFAQQTLLAIRSDILAAALVVWGLAWLLPAFDEERPRARQLAVAALCFVLAAAAKITTLYAPAAAVIALAWSARLTASARLSALIAIGTAAMVGIVALASGGRAIESWRVCAFAGAGMADWLRSLPSAFVSQVIGPSRVFSAVCVVAAGAWAVLLRTNGPRLPLVLFPVALGATAVVLASPGTIATNQLVDVFVVCVLLIGWTLARHPRWQSPAAACLLVLSLAAARQSVNPVWSGELRQHAVRLSAERAELARAVAAIGGPVLSESPETLLAAGVRPYLLDPFALRVVTLERSDVLDDVRRRLDARFFPAVVLEFDPESARGRGWYTNLDLGWPIVSRVLANYELESVMAGLRVYKPKRSAPAPLALTHP